MARINLFNLLEFEWGASKEVAPEVRSNTNWDLKGQTLLDIIEDNGGGDTLTEKTAMKFSGVMAAVSLRSELLASMPKVIFKNLAEGRETDYQDPLYKVIAHQPNAYMNAFTFWELINTHLDLWGNAYVHITRYKGTVVALTPIYPGHVKPMVEGGRFFYRVKDTGDPVLDGDHSPQKLLHFKDISFDGLVGISRIQYAKRTINLGIAQETFSKQFFDKGGHSKGIIEMEGVMDDEAYTTFKKRWNQNANHGTPILDRGKKYHQLSMPIEDAMFIQARQFQLQDIARIYRVPPHLLADLSRATFSNIEHSDIQFVKYSLRPMVKRYEMELETKLLGKEIGEKSIRFNLDGILRGDTATRGEYLSKMVQAKIMNRNEARAVENLNPVDGGDVFENPATSTNKNEETD